MMKMTDDDLINQLETLERQAVGFYGGEIAGEQSKAMDYYLGKPFGTEEEGRSRVVSSDVWDVVEGLAPLILDPFVSSDDVVRFEPVGPEDEEAAQQETDYVNHVVTRKNDVFNELVAWIKTGLLQKNGVVKYWWEKSRRVEIERYEGLSDDVFAAIAQEPGVDVVEHTEQQVEAIGPDGMPVVELVHDVVLRVTHEHGEPKYCVVPPEEFRISRDALSPNPKSARYVAHITRKTLSEIREMGFDVDDDIADQDAHDPQMSEQYLARRNGDEVFGGEADMLDKSQREVTFIDSLARIDFDGDGIAELRRVVKVGRTILLNEEAEEVNYVAWTPYPQPFKFYGRCPADETLEIQLVKSTLWRQSLDNIYTINNNRVYASNKVNLDDLLDNQIAGVVRVDGDVVGNHVMAAQVTPIGGIVQPMIEYLDSAKENRTGFTRYNQGMDAGSLNKTATGVRIIAEAGNQRVKLIARAFAEQGLKPLMLGIHGLCRRHGTKAETIRLRGKWVEVDPRSWKTRFDMTVSVGLGTADKQMQLQGHQMLMAEQKMLAQAGLVEPQNMFNAAAKLAEILGEKSPEKYFADPSKAEPKQPPDPTQNPEFMLKVEDLKMRAQELALKDREVGIKDRDSQVSGLVAHAKLEAELQQIMQMPQIAQSLTSIQEQLAMVNAKGTQDVMTEGQYAQG